MLLSQALFTGGLALGVGAFLLWELPHLRRSGLAPGGADKASSQSGRRDAGPSSGPWGPHTAPIDWCESNYAVSGVVAEFWNTATCAPYVAAGFLALSKAHQRPTGVPPCHALYAVALILTGLCSAVFHATLWWWGQKTDEIFENVTLLALLYSRSERGPVLTLLHGGLAAAGILLIPQIFAELHVAAAVAGLLHVYYGLAVKYDSLGPLVRRAALLGLLAFGCWLADKFVCGGLPRAAQLLQLHSWWHVLTALALYQAGSVALLAGDLGGAGQHGVRGKRE